MCREYTQKEMRDMFLKQLATYVYYWGSDDPKLGSMRRRLGGLAFSMLNILDGTSMGLPAFEIFSAPHPSDKKYHQDNEENWWPDLPDSVEDVKTIHGDAMLHELWSKYCKY